MPIEVTVIFKDDAQFQKFLKTNKVEEYTWKKGHITIDFAKEVKDAMATMPSASDSSEAPAEPKASQAQDNGDANSLFN